MSGAQSGAAPQESGARLDHQRRLKLIKAFNLQQKRGLEESTESSSPGSIRQMAAHPQQLLTNSKIDCDDGASRLEQPINFMNMDQMLTALSRQQLLEAGAMGRVSEAELLVARQHALVLMRRAEAVVLGHDAELLLSESSPLRMSTTKVQSRQHAFKIACRTEQELQEAVQRLASGNLSLPLNSQELLYTAPSESQQESVLSPATLHYQEMGQALVRWILYEWHSNVGLHNVGIDEPDEELDDAGLQQEMDALVEAARACVGRYNALWEVFKVFDLDDSGTIESSELRELGQMRRKLGHKHRKWSESKNARLIKQMDTNGDGLISGDEFCQHFDKALPSDTVEFQLIIGQFKEVAEACRARKQRGGMVGGEDRPIYNSSAAKAATRASQLSRSKIDKWMERASNFYRPSTSPSNSTSQSPGR